MPTAAKLVAAICLAALGFVTSELIKLVLPASTDFGIFTLLNTGIGFIMGWVVVGRRAGRGYSAAISNGFTGMVALVFWGLFIQAVNEMVRLAVRHRYDGPVEALAAIFELLVKFGGQMLDPVVLLTLLCGGIVTGLLTEAAAARWR